MTAYKINHSINYLDIDPVFIEEGMKYATNNSCKSVRIVTLNQNSGNKLDVSFHAFNDKVFIENLIISDDFKFGKTTSVESLYSLNNLGSLQLQQFLNIDFQNFKQLKILYYNHDPKYRNLSSLSHLEDILSTHTKEDDCFFLSELLNLRKVRIDGNIRRMNYIEKLTKLCELQVTYSPKLYDASAIGKVKNLRKLYIEKCKNISDFSFLSDNQNIEELFIDEMDNLEFVKTMPNLRKINFWNCKNGNLLPLLQSQSLIDVSFYPNKKSYTHTKEEIIQLLSEKNTSV
jgi:internalin A